MLLLLLVSVRLSLPASVWHVPEIHILEKFLCVVELLVEFVSTLAILVLSSWGAATALFGLGVPSYAAELVIHSALLFVTKSHHRIVNALECFFSLGSCVLIRVKF